MTDNAHDTDSVTGTKTTGHIWDGIQELNTPLPRWWLWMFYATIIWSVGYWIVYPSWPLVNTYTRGLTNWHARDGIISDLADLKRKRGPLFEKLGSASLSDIRNDPQLSEFARAVGRPAFAENCSPCHGAGGGGAKGYPNLNDDDWLWGGKLEEIAQTVRHGIRSGDAAARPAVAMPAFGRDGMLKRTEIETIADYVRSLAGLGVFVCLVAFFGVVALVNAIMIRAAVSTFGGVETGSAYQAGLAFAHESATARAQDDLRWQVMAELKRADNGVPTIDVAVRDVSGNLVTDLSASAWLSHPADRRSDLPVALDEIGPGQFAGITAAPAGQWDLVLEFTRNGERVFRSRNRIFIR